MTTLLDVARTKLIMASYEFQSITETITCLHKLINIIKSERNKTQWIEENYDALVRIKSELTYLINTRTERPEKQRLIEIRNQLFGSVLRDSIETINERRRVTQLCNEFLKGITYFANETPNSILQPVYHRKGSCSKKGEPNNDCTSGINEETLRSIEKCYIERLVYEQLWQNCMSCQQDVQHLEWLIKTKEAYHTCYPNQNIEVDVITNELETIDTSTLSLHDDSVPIGLKVYIQKNGKIETTMIYTKRYDYKTKTYIYPVTCIKNEHQKLHVKDNTFDSEGEWHEQAGGTRKPRKELKK